MEIEKCMGDSMIYKESEGNTVSSREREEKGDDLPDSGVLDRFQSLLLPLNWQQQIS